jgi:regulator of cell morphogenesis and NO signaling
VIKESKIEDLHLIFPYFVEDFIRHIYEEEDSLFVYLDALIKTINQDKVDEVLLKMLQNNEVSNYFMHHSADDDMMHGVRELTNDYTSEVKSVQLNVLYKELKAFDEACALHAKIENDILFPLAVKLEQKVKDKLIQSKV